MAEIGFYHLSRTPLERALPQLMQKVLDSGARAVIRTESGERAEVLSNLLWTAEQGSFLPHGTARDGDAPEQPLWITPDDENPNGAAILVLVDGVEAADLDGFERCLDLFDGRSAASVSAARQRWARCRDAGHALTYWQQTPRGGWEKKAG